MKTEKSIQFLSNNRKLIAGPCKKQFFLSFYLFYYIHTPVPPLSQANQSDGNRVAREVGFDHHLTTSSPQPVPLIVCTLQHSFITTTTSAGSCARCTISGAGSLYLPVCHSSPTRKAAGSNPPGRTKSSAFWALLFLFCVKLCGMLQGWIRTACAPRLRPGGQKQSCGLFLRRGSANPPGRTKKGRCIAVQRPFLFCHGLVLVNPFFDYVRGNIGHDRHEKTDKIAHGISFPC